MGRSVSVSPPSIELMMIFRHYLQAPKSHLREQKNGKPGLNPNRASYPGSLVTSTASTASEPCSLVMSTSSSTSSSGERLSALGTDGIYHTDANLMFLFINSIQTNLTFLGQNRS